MTKYEELTQEIYDSDTLLFSSDSDKQPAKAMRDEEGCAIFFNELAFETGAERFVAAAHELEHCELGTFYSTLTPLETWDRYEKRTWKQTVLKRLPFDDLMAAFKYCTFYECDSPRVNTWEVAEHLDVTEDFLRVAVDIYARMGMALGVAEPYEE